MSIDTRYKDPEYQIKWKKNNPEYFKEYYKNNKVVMNKNVKKKVNKDFTTIMIKKELKHKMDEAKSKFNKPMTYTMLIKYLLLQNAKTK